MTTYAYNADAETLALEFGVESWHTLERDEQDGWRRVAERVEQFVNERAGDVEGMHDECKDDEDVDQAAQDGFAQAKARLIEGVRKLVASEAPEFADVTQVVADVIVPRLERMEYDDEWQNGPSETAA